MHLAFRFKTVGESLQDRVVLCTAGPPERFVRFEIRRRPVGADSDGGKTRDSGPPFWSLWVVAGGEKNGNHRNAGKEMPGPVQPGQWARIDLRIGPHSGALSLDGRKSGLFATEECGAAPFFFGDAYPARLPRGTPGRSADLLIDLSSVQVWTER